MNISVHCVLHNFVLFYQTDSVYRVAFLWHPIKRFHVLMSLQKCKMIVHCKEQRNNSFNLLNFKFCNFHIQRPYAYVRSVSIEFEIYLFLINKLCEIIKDICLLHCLRSGHSMASGPVVPTRPPPPLLKIDAG